MFPFFPFLCFKLWTPFARNLIFLDVEMITENVFNIFFPNIILYSAIFWIFDYISDICIYNIFCIP